MRIFIRPEYRCLSDFIKKIPQHFDHEGEVLYARRNVIRKMRVGEFELNVKRYGVPSFFNRLIYTFFRKSKGWRAYTYPDRLLASGIETPHPVAYIEERRGGLLHYSYFVSIQCPYTRNFYEFGDARIADCRDVVSAFAKFSARLHDAGILHLDYSPGNILFDRVENEWRFSLIDINRMRFGTVSVEQGCANFARLWGQVDFFKQLAYDYAAARNAEPEQCCQWVLHYRRKFWQRYRRRHELKFRLEL